MKDRIFIRSHSAGRLAASVSKTDVPSPITRNNEATHAMRSVGFRQKIKNPTTTPTNLGVTSLNTLYQTKAGHDQPVALTAANSAAVNWPRCRQITAASVHTCCSKGNQIIKPTTKRPTSSKVMPSHALRANVKVLLCT